MSAINKLKGLFCHYLGCWRRLLAFFQGTWLSHCILVSSRASNMKLSNVNDKRKLLPCEWGWSKHKQHHCSVRLVFCVSTKFIQFYKYIKLFCLFTVSSSGEIHQDNLKCFGFFSRNLHLDAGGTVIYFFLPSWFRQQVVLIL